MINYVIYCHGTIPYHIYICRIPDVFFKVFHLHYLMLAEAMKSYRGITYILKDLCDCDLLQNCKLLTSKIICISVTFKNVVCLVRFLWWSYDF